MDCKPLKDLSAEIEKKIAHFCACYGDEPKELMYKLHQLVIKYYCKEIESGLKDDCKNEEEAN